MVMYWSFRLGVVQCSGFHPETYGTGWRDCRRAISIAVKEPVRMRDICIRSPGGHLRRRWHQLVMRAMDVTVHDVTVRVATM